eukprot:GHVL01022681.1.p1 GENE.GHVL01022681.1~~GHVL01022681.1.p1  ORF type:complete len:301 (-),score=42.60 GHVL01022681.1:1193-2095(-)
MPLVKVIKNKAYFKRYQVKYRRRREGKTDYHARRKLVAQDKTRYNSPKHRFVVRFTNTRVICQIIYSTIVGDHIVESADSKELKQYGIPVGLTNYASAYATGLLCARRLLKKIGLDKSYKGVEEVNGEEYHPDEEGEKRPFKAYLDVGLKRTTTGAKVFGALKGAVDGGVNIPHTSRRFPGYEKGETKAKEGSYNAEEHKKRIFGEHVKEYMDELKGEEEDTYQRQFAGYIKSGITSDAIVAMYKKAHSKIRENPDRTKKTRQKPPVKYTAKPKKLTMAQRKERVLKKIDKFHKADAAQA